MLTDEQKQALWNEACKDTPQAPGWNRHIRYAASIESAATAPLLARIAELEAKLAQRVPDGWKMVPVELTAEMRAAAKPCTTVSHLWASILSAAPAAPEQQEPTDSMGIPVSCGKPLCSPGDHHPLCAQAPNAQQAEPPPWWPAVENILNEYGLQAVDFVADFKAAQQAEAQEPCAYIRRDQLQKAAQAAQLCEVTPEPRQDRVAIFTRPKPAQLQRLSAEEVRDAINANGMMFTAPDLRIAEYVTDALAAKNGVGLV